MRKVISEVSVLFLFPYLFFLNLSKFISVDFFFWQFVFPYTFDCFGKNSHAVLKIILIYIHLKTHIDLHFNISKIGIVLK